MSLELGYEKLLNGDVAAAKLEFSSLASVDTRANWACKLIQFIECDVSELPTYFQVRNFLEIDLNLLIEAGQSQFVENIINGVELFFEVNPESYKFIARVLISNDFHSVALHFLLAAKDNFYYDPELHFLLAQVYFNDLNFSAAEESLADCLEIFPEYYPALNLISKIKGLRNSEPS